MARSSLAVLLAFVFLSVAHSLARAQRPPEPDKKQADGAIYAVNYDIRDLTHNPGAGTLVAAIVALEDPSGAKPTMLGRDAIQVLNETHLVIRTNATRHAEIETLLAAYRRVADMAVFVHARLYEVDEAFYQRLKSVKRVPLDELEKNFLDGKSADDDDLYKLLGKQKMIQAGDELKVDNGQDVALLSRQNAFTCLPGRAQVRRGEKTRQTILEGVTFVARLNVSADRRHVNVTLTEKATHVEEVLKVKTWDPTFRRQLDAEVPFVQESAQTRVLEISDGWTILVPVDYRPASVEARARRWVLSITPRIYIDEEERQLRSYVVPALVTAVLQNPHLKAIRDFYGSPDDKRFALLASDAVALPDKLGPVVAGYQLVPADGKGKRLLGIRIDRYDDAAITVSLVNAGGTANGPAAGRCTVRYTVRSVDEKWVAELLEP